MKIELDIFSFLVFFFGSGDRRDEEMTMMDREISRVSGRPGGALRRAKNGREESDGGV